MSNSCLGRIFSIPNRDHVVVDVVGGVLAAGSGPRLFSKEEGESHLKFLAENDPHFTASAWRVIPVSQARRELPGREDFFARA